MKNKDCEWKKNELSLEELEVVTGGTDSKGTESDPSMKEMQQRANANQPLRYPPRGDES